MAVLVADLERRTGPDREIAVAGAVDEDLRAHRLPAGLGLHHQRVDAAVVAHHHAGAERMEKDVHLVAGEKLIGRNLVGRGVIGLGEDLAEDQMRRVEAVQAIDSRQQFGRHALHQPVRLAVDVTVKAAKVGDAGGGSHAAEEAVALDQQRPPSGARSGCCRHDAGRAAAENDDFIFAVERHLARRFFDRRGPHGASYS
ncbi:hypothetical protein ACVWXO_003036 [Bradyrhizobium sp. LM2.7]